MDEATGPEMDADLQRRPATERHERGVAQLAALLNHWLGRAGLSHDQLVAITGWGLGEPGAIDGGVISRVRNARQARGAGWKHLDALAAANEAIWLWQVKGADVARAKLGPPSSWGIKEEWLDQAVWLAVPNEADEPLRLAEMAEVVTGHLVLPYLATTDLSPIAARAANDRLVELVDAVIAKRGLGMKAGLTETLKAYPTTDQARQRRLKAVITGDARLNREELELEMQALAEMLRVLRKLPAGGYGADALRAELLPDRLLGS